MKDNKLISIIIPVYNAELYIAEMLESIFSQTYDCYEVICVNDGSTDSSAEIVRRYMEGDSRIRQIHQENLGVSAARNAGIAAARGEYICFLDADDFLNPTYLETMMDATIGSGASIISCAYYLYYNEAHKEAMLTQEATLDRNAAVKDMLQNKLLGMSAWNKLFEKTIIPKDGFPTGFRINEDRYFVFQTVANASCVKVIPTPLYYYRCKQDSSSRKEFGEQFLDIVKLSEKMYDWICMNMPELKPDAYANVYGSAYHVLRILYAHQADREFKNIKKELIAKISQADFTVLKGRLTRSRYYQMICAKYCEPLLRFMLAIQAVLKRGNQ